MGFGGRRPSDIYTTIVLNLAWVWDTKNSGRAFPALGKKFYMPIAQGPQQGTRHRFLIGGGLFVSVSVSE